MSAIQPRQIELHASRELTPAALEVLFSDPIKARESILELEAAMRDEVAAGALVDTAGEHPLEHSFIPGAYARQMLILKGHLIIGKLHRNPCFNFIMRGRCRVFSEDGVRDITAPFFFVSKPGAKRVVYAYEETLWVTCHGTHKTDLVEIEAELIAPNYEALAEAGVA